MTGAAAIFQSYHVDRNTVVCPLPIVQVEEAATPALVEDGRAAKSKRVVRAEREAGGVNCPSLWWRVELEPESLWLVYLIYRWGRVTPVGF